jgi:hypothetical protein
VKFSVIPSWKVVFGRLVAGSTPAVAGGTNGANVCPSSLEWLTYSVAVEVLAGWGTKRRRCTACPRRRPRGRCRYWRGRSVRHERVAGNFDVFDFQLTAENSRS